MKLWTLATFLTVSILTFSACSGLTPTTNETAVVDSTLPLVELTPNGVFTDMKAVGLEWNAINDQRVKGIYIYKQALGDEASEFKFHDTVKNRFVTHYVDTDVEPQSKYAYYFKTYSKEAESNPSKETLVSTLPILDSVSWIHAVANMPRSAKIIWRPHTNQIVEKYILERKTLEEDEWGELETLNGRLTAEYIDADLKDEYVYKYRVRVVTYNDITSNPSQEVKVVTKSLPNQVSEILATKDLPKQILVIWNKSEIKDFSHYNVYRAEKIDGGYDLLTTTKENEFLNDIEDDGEDYFYRISMVDKDGLESKNDVLSAHGTSLVKPQTPSLVEAHMVGKNLEISWNSSDPRIKSFMVSKKAKKSWFDSTNEDFIDIKGENFIDPSIAPETTYTYIVYSVDEFSIKSEPSIEVKYTTTKDEGQVVSEAVEQSQALESAQRNSAPATESSEVIQAMDLDVGSL